MDDMNGIQIEEQNVSSAITWGIISGIYVAVISFFMGAISPLILSPNEVFRDGLRTIYPLLYLSEWVVTIATVIWVVKIAMKLKRSPIIWGLCALLFPPVTLIVIGFQGYKIGDKNVRNIVNELRLDFESELLHIRSTKDLTGEELSEVELKLKEKFNQKIRERIAEGRFNEKSESMSEEEKDKLEEQSIIEAEKEEEEVVQAVAPKNWTSEINKCPACSASVTEKTTICPECGLALN
jgi:hypothetical protein